MRLVDPIRDKGYALMDTLSRSLRTADLQRPFYGVPLWKHLYHALYWLDYWFCAPDNFLGAAFHVPGLEDIDTPPTVGASAEQLMDYFEKVAAKTRKYLDTLTDDMLYEQPAGCDTNRLGLILGQFKHVYCHVGNVNGRTVDATGTWVYVAGGIGDEEKPLFE